ncbi:uncharacterized protein NEPG_02109 [Nematocida parisii ERTm1]|uniref:uncharacterized protein n=1 Tax=Nematocida parisii (strain ERTm1 / ATCC PRA-289) TaxID=881290 RepID=UPI000264B7F3|nr:uncharacterized protein NEPG_02109 [Nematocida parisii ERTm1]EIJ93153.1 hypothetical protein NEPG_02109 [Nematocida parisii ERTm1]|eukprot:XP_013059936.1 hypothetical protein NEPG_02109 [Nematocida parisii ERTm1]
MIQHWDSAEVFALVYAAVQIFYRHKFFLQQVSYDEQKSIKYKTPLMHVGLCFKEPYLKILGASTVATKKYFKSFSTLKKIIIKPNVFSSSSYTMHKIMKASGNKNNEISIKDHYHIQCVNNSKHTVEIAHIPYYIHRQKNGKKVKREFHTIKYIALHLRKIFSIGYNQIGQNIGKIYPFKYSREDKTWSLITDKSDLNKTVQAIENENCNVVFYYIKENIYETEFCFAQFVYPPEIKDIVNDENIDKPRIPLFLSKFMVSGSVLGPYDESVISYKVYSMQNYKCMKPINYLHDYTEEGYNDIMKSSLGTIENTTTLSVKELHMRKNSLNYAIKYYYSDFFIRKSTDPYEDIHCYDMNIMQKESKSNGTVNISWNTQERHSAYEYTSYAFDSTVKDERLHMQAANQPAITSFINMLQRKNPSINTALYGYCIYKNSADIDYKASAVFCLTMRDLLERMNTHLLDLNRKYEKIDPVTGVNLFSTTHGPKFNLKDISNAIQDSNLEEIKQCSKGVMFIRDNNYNSCKYGFHYDILNVLSDDHFEDTHFNSNSNKPTSISTSI